jgi:hypothetical protein
VERHWKVTPFGQRAPGGAAAKGQAAKYGHWDFGHHHADKRSG